MKKQMIAGAILLTCGMMTARSWSQPQAGEAGKAGNPANPPAAKTEKQQIAEIMQKSQQAALDVMNMTPAQREAWMQKMQADGMRMTLANAGFNDLELAESLRLFTLKRAQSRRPLSVTSTLLYLASSKTGLKLSDAQFAALLSRYEREVAAQKEKEARTLDDLDDEIGWKTLPRLRAVLLQNGIIGDAAWYGRSELFSMSAAGSTDLEIVQFWNANQKLPPGIELPAAQEIPPAQ